MQKTFCDRCHDLIPSRQQEFVPSLDMRQNNEVCKPCFEGYKKAVEGWWKR